MTGPRSVVAALHLPEPSGPSRALQPVLEHLSRDASVVVAVPCLGRTAEELRGVARVEPLGHGPLMFPRGLRDIPRVAACLRSDTRRFRALLRRERADLAIISTTTLPALALAARLERVPSIVYATELYRQGRRSDVARMPARAASFAANARLATVTVTCSRTVEAELPRGTRSYVMYPPIDPLPAPGDAASFRARFGIPATSPTLATLGNVSRGRGQDVAIRAVADLRRDLPGARLIVANAPHPREADLAYAAELAGLAERLGVADAVHFCGLADRADVFAASDVVVNPARFAETFGIVATEALVAGVPVVSTDVGAVPEVLGHERHALLVPSDRPETMAAAVRRLVAEPQLAARLVDDGRAHVLASYSRERQLPRFDEAVAAALGAGANGASAR
jgi:glycosyltransferase involved in cell wall biosynthesis